MNDSQICAQVMRYRGRAAVPLPGVFGGFSKVFFVQPDTFELYGRVKVMTCIPCSFILPCLCSVSFSASRHSDTVCPAPHACACCVCFALLKYCMMPQTAEFHEWKLQVHKGPLGDLLYPLYFRCNIGPSSIPGAAKLTKCHPFMMLQRCTASSCGPCEW